MSESNESYEEFKSFDYDSLSEEQKMYMMPMPI